MPVPNWPVSLRQQPRRGTWTGGPQDSRATFEPEYGPPLHRRRTTADPVVYDGVVFPNLSGVQAAAFDAFWQNDLSGGALAFAWRDPVTDAPALWRIIGGGKTAYSIAARGANLHDLSLNLMRLPGSPWWGPYLRPASSIVPVLVLDFLGQKYGAPPDKASFASLVSLTRASAATYVDAAGVEQTAAINVPRIDANGLLIETASTNLALWSEAFDDAVWTKTLTTITANATAGPNGATTADKLIETAVAGTHFTNQAFTGRPTNTTHTYTCFVKAAERSRGTIRMNAGSDQVLGDFDLVAGTIAGSVAGLGVLGAVSIQTLANGWFRVRVSGIPNPTTTAYTCQINLRDGSGNASYTGDGTSGFFVRGAQFAQNAAPTSYTATNAATATRAADVVSLVSAITARDVRIVDRSGTVTTLLNTTIAAATWPAAAVAGARSIIAYPVGTL